MDEILKKKPNKKDEVIKELIYFARTIVITSVCVFMVMQFVAQPISVDGPSMEPTLTDNEFGFSNIFSKLINNFNRFDIVVAHYEETDSLWVKRIIGLPSEVIEYKGDKLYVDGKYIKEDYFDRDYVNARTYDGDLNFTDDFGPITLKDDEYFLMGDNRFVSYDSRKVGPFKEDELESKAIFVLMPFNKIGFKGSWF